jgi:tripeptide aminopeptidase
LNAETAGLVEDIIALAKIPAPTFQEAPRIAWIRERLRDAPGEVHEDHVGNVVWRWGTGSPRLLITAHVDNVFPADTALAPRVEDEMLCGPGIGDNAAGIAVAINVLEKLCRDGALRPGAVAFTVCEEGLGNVRGAAAACNALRPAAMVALEGHGLECVVADEVGSIRARVVIVGPGGHSWVNRGVPSALHALFEIGTALVAGSRPDAPINIGTAAGGQAVNVVADRAEFVVEQRSLEERSLQAFACQLELLRVAPPLEVSIEIVGRRYAGRIPRDSALLKVVEDIRTDLDLPNVFEARSTDAGAALRLGIPALSLGVARGNAMHTLGENIEIDSLRLGREQLRQLVLRVLGEDRSR